MYMIIVITLANMMFVTLRNRHMTSIRLTGTNLAELKFLSLQLKMEQ
jgi:hypothetical protein